MKLLLPFLLLLSLTFQAKNLDIMECLRLIHFEPEKYSSGDFSFEGIQPMIDFKNGYYELKDPNSDIKYIQAAKFNNGDGSITLMITGYEYDMVCSRYNTRSYLIYADGEKAVEMDKDDLSLTTDLIKFIDSDKLEAVMAKILKELKGKYLDENASLDNLYNEFFDFHYKLPQTGTSIVVSVTICDYIPTNEIEVNEEDWNTIEESIPTRSYAFDKKYVIFGTTP